MKLAFSRVQFQLLKSLKLLNMKITAKQIKFIKTKLNFN